MDQQTLRLGITWQKVMEKTGLPRDHCGFSNLGTLNRLNSAYLYVFLGFGDSP